ncbi:small multi-drug export protein [Pseudoflavonifractor sp. An176]|uniref:COG2426 family protein n=1 Tax=Pseudoflavonifractor sp. An176 TaxID=1965572 RepID=UPI0026BFF5FD
MDLMQWLTTDLNGEFILTLLVSMLPVVELRGGIPFGVAAGLPVWAAYLAAVIGNLLPVPFIVVYIQRIFMFMRQNMPRLNSVVDKMEQKAHLKSASVLKYQYLGLAIFVAIPLPGTGAWTGALVAAFLDMRLKKALPSIAGGVLSAGLIISILSYGVKSLF